MRFLILFALILTTVAAAQPQAVVFTEMIWRDSANGPDGSPNHTLTATRFFCTDETGANATFDRQSTTPGAFRSVPFPPEIQALSGLVECQAASVWTDPDGGTSLSALGNRFFTQCTGGQCGPLPDSAPISGAR